MNGIIVNCVVVMNIANFGFANLYFRLAGHKEVNLYIIVHQKGTTADFELYGFFYLGNFNFTCKFILVPFILANSNHTILI